MQEENKPIEHYHILEFLCNRELFPSGISFELTKLIEKGGNINLYNQQPGHAPPWVSLLTQFGDPEELIEQFQNHIDFNAINSQGERFFDEKIVYVTPKF